jgi:PAS domain-containing protein
VHAIEDVKMSARAPASQESTQPTVISDRYSTPLKLVITIAALVFAVEVIEPIFFPLLPPMSRRLEALLDGMVMTAVLAPLLYFLIVRRMVDQIARREAAEDELQRVNTELESLLNERTNDLVGASRQLSRLIDEQRGTEASLDRTNRFVGNVFEKAPCIILTFDAGSRQCVYVNGRITDLLGYSQDELAASMRDFVDELIWKSERDRFAAVLKEVSVAKEATVAHGTCGFVSAAGKRVELAFGVTVLDRTPTLQARNLLLTAMPAAV